MPEREEEQLLALLRRVFDGGDTETLTRQDLAAYAGPHIRVHLLKKRQLLMRTGAEVAEILLLVNGRYYLSRFTQNGAQVVVDHHFAPRFFGIVQMIHHSRIFSDVVAVSDCLTVGVEVAYFNQIRLSNPLVADYILRDMCGSMVKTACRMDRSSFFRTDDNLVAYLYQKWMENHFRYEPLEIVSTKELIAGSIGVSLRTVYRSMKRLEERDLMTITPKGIRVSTEQLRRIKLAFADMQKWDGLPERSGGEAPRGKRD